MWILECVSHVIKGWEIPNIVEKEYIENPKTYRITSAHLNSYTGKHHYQHWCSRKLQEIIEFNKLSFISQENLRKWFDMKKMEFKEISRQTILNSLYSNNQVDTIKSYIQEWCLLYNIFKDFYSQKKFLRRKFHTYCMKKKMVDQWIKEKIFGVARMGDLVYLTKKILFIIGNAKMRFNIGLKTPSLTSSFGQILDRLKLLVKAYGLQDKVKFLFVPEWYTSQCCSRCHERSLERLEKKCIEKDENGNEVEVKKRIMYYLSPL